MQAFFNDPDVKRLPPAEMHLIELAAASYPDGRRLRVHLEFTPFEKSPTLELTVRDAQGNAVAATTIIEPFTWRQELTMHIREGQPLAGTHRIEAVLLYPDLGEIDRREAQVT